MKIKFIFINLFKSLNIFSDIFDDIIRETNNG